MVGADLFHSAVFFREFTVTCQLILFGNEHLIWRVEQKYIAGVTQGFHRGLHLWAVTLTTEKESL